MQDEIDRANMLIDAAVQERATTAQRSKRLRVVPPSAAAGENEPAPDDGIAAPDGSEDQLATQFVERHGHEYVCTPGMGWMRDLGTHFASDDDLSRYDRARTIAREAAAYATDLKEAKRLASAKTVASIITLAHSDPRSVVPVNAWDKNPNELNTPKGIVNLVTGAMRERATDHVTQITRVSPDFETAPDTWLQFLQDVFEGDAAMIGFIQRLTGYTLTADRREQKLFFCFGLGSNGKSTLWDTVAWILGSYCLKLPSSALMRTNSDPHPTGLAQLRGKRLAISSELDEGQHLNEARIKEVTGDETLTARFMRQDFFEFPQTQKHVMVGNYRPRVQGGDTAIARRLVLVPFKASFTGKTRDKDLLQKLRAEAPSILAWMVNGATKWYAEGLGMPHAVADASTEYLGDNDDLTLWMNECCVLDLLGSKTQASLLYASFAHWIKARGQHVLAQRTWGERMGSVKGIQKVKASCVIYTGIRLSNAEIQRMNEVSQRGFS